MAEKYSHLNVTIEGALAIIELNRPPVNAINLAVIRDVHRAAVELNANENVKVALLIGAGKHFAAGADIKEIAALEPGDAVADFSEKGSEAFLTVERGRVLFIALVRGYCLGGGCELAMACHMRIADSTAVFGQPEIKLGICPGFGATQRLPRLVGRSRSLYLLMTGEQLNAQTSHQYGLATLLVPEGHDLLEFGKSVGGRIAKHGKKVVRAILELVDYRYDISSEQGIIRETELFGELSQTEDMREGFEAFLAKREPVFRDK